LDRAIDILYVIDRFQWSGGTELQLAGLISRLDRRRYRPHLCVLNVDTGACCLRDCGYLELDVAALARPNAVRQAGRLYRYLRDHRVQILHSFFQDSTMFSLPVARAAGVPSRVVSFRDLGFWRTKRSEFLMRRAYRFATGFLANSSSVKQVVVERDRVSPESISVIPNGVSPKSWPFRETTPNPPRVLYVGNLNREVKRPDLLVEAAGLLVQQVPSVQWYCIGDGHLRPRLEARVAQLGLSGSFHFLGRRLEVRDLLGEATIGVSCSDSEGLSNSILEYMLAGAAVVATDVGGNREIVDHERTGLLVPPNDAHALASAIERLLMDAVLADRMRRTARAKVERSFSWEACVEAHHQYYEKQLAEHS
jgi:glycosyltransferase involved in cell wall biosynthesis